MSVVMLEMGITTCQLTLHISPPVKCACYSLQTSTVLTTLEQTIEKPHCDEVQGLVAYFSQSISQSISQSVNQSINQSISQSINQSWFHTAACSATYQQSEARAFSVTYRLVHIAGILRDCATGRLRRALPD